MHNYFNLFMTFFKLGCTSFGGPVAHLAYFREELVHKRSWVNDKEYADIIALCHFLPGPGSSQVGLSLGYCRKKYWGGLLAWFGFTLPSALLMICAAIGLTRYQNEVPEQLIHGLKIVAVAVVALAVWKMYLKLCSGYLKTGMMIITAICILTVGRFINMPLLQISLILFAGVLGFILLRNDNSIDTTKNHLKSHATFKLPSLAPLFFIALFFTCLFFLPILAKQTDHPMLQAFASFYKTGSLVFGGGHVVLPLLEAETVAKGLIHKDTFLAGYGLAQAVPGPLFSFAAFLGGSIFSTSTGSIWIGALLCLSAIYLPSFLLIYGIFPFWQRISQNASIQAIFSGINAAVVGLLLAALYDPIWTNAIFTFKDLLLALAAYMALAHFKVPTWMVVLSTAFAAWIFL